MQKYIGMDIGGTHIRAAVIDAKGKIILKVKSKTEVKKGGKTVIKNIIHTISMLKAHNVKAIGIGVPGLIDKEKGLVINSPNLPINNLKIKKIIQKEFKKPVFIDNDANCFTLGEAIYGAGKNKKHVIGLTLGTGIGGGIVINKKIYHGRAYAGELGHITINFNGPKARCGNNGCIESYISARGITKRAKNTPKKLFELAKKRNKKALKVWNDTGFYLGLGITNIVNALDPDIVVIGGNISRAWKFFNKNTQKTVKDKAFIKKTKIVRSKLLENAAMIGAAVLCTK